jgi:hypothetical protein
MHTESLTSRKIANVVGDDTITGVGNSHFEYHLVARVSQYRSPQVEHVDMPSDMAEIVDNVRHDGLPDTYLPGSLYHCILVFEDQRHRKRDLKST